VNTDYSFFCNSSSYIFNALNSPPFTIQQKIGIAATLAFGCYVCYECIIWPRSDVKHVSHQKENAKKNKTEENTSREHLAKSIDEIVLEGASRTPQEGEEKAIECDNKWTMVYHAELPNPVEKIESRVIQVKQNIEAMQESLKDVCELLE
jgi:hypothetical protein